MDSLASLINHQCIILYVIIFNIIITNYYHPQRILIINDKFLFCNPLPPNFHLQLINFSQRTTSKRKRVIFNLLLLFRRVPLLDPRISHAALGNIYRQQLLLHLLWIIVRIPITTRHPRRVGMSQRSQTTEIVKLVHGRCLSGWHSVLMVVMMVTPSTTTSCCVTGRKSGVAHHAHVTGICSRVILMMIHLLLLRMDKVVTGCRHCVMLGIRRLGVLDWLWMMLHGIGNLHKKM